MLALALALPAAAADTPEQVLRKAQELADQGQASRAADLYRAFLKDNARHSQAVEAHYRLAKCLDSLGMVDEVIEQLQIVARPEHARFRQRADALYMLGKLHGSLKQYHRAAGVFEQLLSEGAGLYEEEVLSLSGGYYAVLKKYDDAAAKLNILKRRQGSRFAEQAAYKLAVLWLRAENLDLAIEAVQDLATRFPRNAQARELMVQVAGLFRTQRQYDKAIAACLQIRAAYPKTREADAVGYIIGLCYRDRKVYDKAVAAFDETAKILDNRKNGLAAEALLQSADVFYFDLADPDKAMGRYDEAAKVAREGAGERKQEILEQCYFRLAEHAYARKSWSVALEYYMLLRGTGTKINVLPRIMKCQAQMNTDLSDVVTSAAEIEYIKKKIEENAGTFAAAEGEVFLLDQKLTEGLERKNSVAPLAEQYQELLKKYPLNILSQQSLESYIYAQIGTCLSRDPAAPDFKRALAMYEKALAVDPRTPYLVEVLENIARVADVLGDKARSFAVYRRLFELTEKRVAAGDITGDAPKDMADYLRSMLVRAEQKHTLQAALDVANQIIDKRGPFSAAARNALLYLGELYFVKKDFSTAATTFRRFIKVYGPKQDGNGDLVGAPWKPAKIDEQVRQVYEAAIRVAHCWYMQGHDQNMVKAYQWVIDNVPHQNDYVAEAEYWLAMEGLKGRKGKETGARLKVAETLWKKVVHPSFDFKDRNFSKGFHPWVREGDMQKYARSAILKAGEFTSEADDHERAASIFNTYLELYSPSSSSRRQPKADDEMYSIARYALGREYIKLGDTSALIDCYKPYLDQLRGDRFRVSALMLLAYHAMKAEAYAPAADAYAALLDEYGDNARDSSGEPVPVPSSQRIRKSRTTWDGIRMKPPADLDLGAVRYSLGYLYWKSEDWYTCVKILAPFVTDVQLFDNKSRPKALFMVTQSCYRAFDYDQGVKVALKLIQQNPTFEAIEEVYVHAVRGCAETGRWADIDRLAQKFHLAHPRSMNLPHVDLYAALAALKQGKADAGARRLAGIADSETYQDVKADACTFLAEHYMQLSPPQYSKALELLSKSVTLYPRQRSCLAAARCCIELKQLEQAKTFLQRTIREFPAGDRKTLSEAKKMLSDLLKEMANKT